MELNQFLMSVALRKFLVKNSTIKLKLETILLTIEENRPKLLKSKSFILRRDSIQALLKTLSQILKNSSFILTPKDMLNSLKFDFLSSVKEITFTKLDSTVVAISQHLR